MALDEKEYYDGFQKCDIPEQNNLYTKEVERYKSALDTALDKFEIKMYWDTKKHSEKIDRCQTYFSNEFKSKKHFRFQ